eukprot:jgi/Orpsp1_1/1184931/evm.model.c7180000091636.1
MQNNINTTLNIYFEKQKYFRALVKNIQYSLQSKEYKHYDYSIDEFIRLKWNIS